MELNENKKNLYKKISIWSAIFEIMLILITGYMFFILINHEIIIAILSLIIAICMLIYITTLNKCVMYLMRD
mgnify:FL=1